MASNIDIQKKCEWCGKLFIAHKTTTRCCSHRCANLAYKERTRQKRVSEFQTMVNQQIEKEDCIDKDFFTPSEAAKYIGISRATFYTHELNYSTFANSYLIILPNKKSVLYLRLRNRYFGNMRFGTKKK